jgi:hypothetical protein
MNAVSSWNPASARSWRVALGGALLGAFLAIVLPPLLNAAAQAVRVAVRVDDARPAIVREWPERPLPREWRWSPPGVKVDHMFRKRR